MASRYGGVRCGRLRDFPEVSLRAVVGCRGSRDASCAGQCQTAGDELVDVVTEIFSEEPTLGVAVRPLRRTTRRALLGGVCGGLAVRCGVRARTLRIAFAVGALVGGVGLVVYTIFWLSVPRGDEDVSIVARLGQNRRDARAFSIGVTVTFLILASVGVIGLWGPGGFVWSLAISGVGLVGIWRGSSELELAHLEELVRSAPLISGATRRGWRGLFLRLVPGVILVAVGLHVLGQLGGIWGSTAPALIGTSVLILGALVLFAPWWLATVHDLSRERRDRVRAEERSAMAAHLHDSVLQSLTLIERVAHDPDEVIRIARAEERSLRRWLFDVNGEPKDDTATLASLINELHEEIERDYGVSVEIVVVGDREADESVRALVGATREAMRNAARWSGAKRFSVYVEVESAQTSIFVRDTGIGFDPLDVESDRQGISLSIRERMAQVGGRAEIRSVTGQGTEVELTLETK